MLIIIKDVGCPLCESVNISHCEDIKWICNDCNWWWNEYDLDDSEEPLSIREN